MPIQIKVSRRGAERWDHGHPWIFASDVLAEEGPAGIVAVVDPRGKMLGQALYSPTSTIRLRLLDRGTEPIGIGWWTRKIAAALARRGAIDATAYRAVHGEGDELPSLIVDRYDRWLVVQLLSAGLDTRRDEIVAALRAVFDPAGILLRHDASVRRHEGLSDQVEVAFGDVPRTIDVREGAIVSMAAPWTGQKTGAFLDQRPARLRAGALMPPGGRGLDCFSYHGSFALHLAPRAGSVIALDISADALERGAENARRNGFENITCQEADAFDALRTFARARRRFDLVVVDPPAFAKAKAAVPKALNGYKDINLHAMRLVEPGGFLVSASCSFHVRWPEFLTMLATAAADSGRRVTIVEHITQGVDHPEIATIPETGYLKTAVLRVD